MITNKSRIEWDTKAERDKYVALLSKKFNAPTIANILRIGKRTVYRIQEALDIQTSHRPAYYSLDYKSELQIIELYNNKIATCQIADQFNITPDTVLNIVRRHGSITRNSRESLRLALQSDKHNDFEYIDSEQKSYIVGLICADGNITGNVVTIGLKDSDSKLLYDIQRFLNIGSVNVVNNSGFKLARFRMCKSKIVEDLKNIGIIDFKSDRPNLINSLDDNLFRAFLLGFFDGDGILCRSQSQCGFVGTKNVMESINNKINSVLGISFNLFEHGSIYKLITGNKQYMLKFLKWLYQADIFCLKRKEKLAKAWINRLSYDLKWFNGNRFSAGNFSVRPPSLRIKLIKEVVEKVSSRWIPPSYTANELRSDLNKCIGENVDVLKKARRYGRKLMINYNPHFWDVKVRKTPTIPEVWTKASIRKCMNILSNNNGSVTFERLIREIQFQLKCNVASLFHPGFTRSIFRRFNISKHMTVFDPCGGWGGRLIGAYIDGVNYISTEVDNNTYNGLVGIKRFLGSNCTIHNKSCFDIVWPKYDVVLTSPPFFNSEDYSQWQCHKDWVERFVKPFLDRVNARCILHLNKTTMQDFASIRQPDDVVEIKTRPNPRASWSHEYLVVFN